ncbi:MAG: hypothetical protein H6Q68_1385 [Firmicutes bacterium]|nr:hypothetical protein [Bacillota bacterium]
MIIKNALQKIEGIVRSFKHSGIDERLSTYITIVTLLNRIEDIAKDKNYPNYKIYKQELLTSCEVLCGLDDNNGHDDGEQIGRALLAVRKMGSYTCFNVDNHYI